MGLVASTTACTASSTGRVARPSVSPWNEASTYLRPPALPAAVSTSRSPLATLPLASVLSAAIAWLG